MKKRLRKKLRRGEFAEYVFPIRGSLSPRSHREDEFWDQLTTFVESLGLGYSGTLSPSGFDGVVARFGRGTATEADRMQMDHWLRARPSVTSYAIGPLVDAWCGAWSEVRPIEREEDYESALAEADSLMDAKAGTPAGERLDVLAALIEAYEACHWPEDAPHPTDRRTPEDAVRAALAALVPLATLERVPAEDLDRVLQELDGFLTPARISKWLIGVNAQLGGRSPIFMLAHGDVDAVLKAVQVQKAGSFA